MTTLPTASAPTSHLLSLPRELRDQIYSHLLPHSIDYFAETARRPALLYVNHQLREEYIPIFYFAPQISLDTYYADTDSWTAIREPAAKRVILENCRFADLSTSWSLASARRLCQRAAVDDALGREGKGVQRGIMTVATTVGKRRWLWTGIRTGL